MHITKHIALAVLLLAAIPLVAQTAPTVSPSPAPSKWTNFSMVGSAMSLPVKGYTSIGTEVGATFNLTTNFALRESNILTPGANFQFYGGGFNTDIISPPNASSHQHYAFKAGGGVRYDLTGKGTWTFGGEVEYAKLPGLINNTWIAKLGPALHF